MGFVIRVRDFGANPNEEAHIHVFTQYPYTHTHTKTPHIDGGARGMLMCAQTNAPPAMSN